MESSFDSQMTSVGLVWDLRPEVFEGSSLPRWYGLCFAGSFLAGYLVFRWMLRREHRSADLLDRLLMAIVAGTVAGMRLGHCLFYQPEIYLRDPLRILKVWEGGYASHGGFAGVLIALWLFARKKEHGMPFFWLADRIAISAILTAAGIRIGNFTNSEMFGHPTSIPWAIIFSRIDMVPRHPAQLYEAFGYLFVFASSLFLYARTRFAESSGRVLGYVLATGFAWRFFVEFFKEDQVAWEQGLTINMGQMLSLPFIALGIGLVIWRRPKNLSPLS